MSIFTYEAYDKDNKIIHGEYEASSREQAMEYLKNHSWTPVSLKLAGSKNTGKNILAFQMFERLNSEDILFLIRNLSTTIKAGLSVVESLEILIDDAEKNLMKVVLRKAQAVIKNGRPLSEGFDEYKDSFPPIFIGMIKAGEVSGQLDKTLSELARYLSKEYELRSKIKTALTYPVILLIASVTMVTAMLMFVIPKLAQSFTQSGVTIPWITRFFLFISGLLTFNYILDIILLAGIIWFFLIFRRTKTGKKFFFVVMSHTPVARDLIKQIALVRFARTFGNLIGSGMPAVDSLKISSISMNNQNYSVAIDKIIVDIRNGIPISESLGKYPKLFPKLLKSLVTVGERTGSLHEILISFADFYEEEVDNKLKQLTSLLEPALLLIMGLLIGAIAVSIILPIYQLVGHFV